MFENLEKIQGDVTKQGSWQDIAATCDAIVHLAGAGVMDKPWSPAYKDILRTSRIDSTRNCAEVGAELLKGTRKSRKETKKGCKRTK